MQLIKIVSQIMFILGTVGGLYFVMAPGIGMQVVAGFSEVFWSVFLLIVGGTGINFSK